MNIGLITFHFVHNQGGVLQCYALKTILEKMGHHVQIIDYQPRYHTVRYARFKNPFIYTRWFWKQNENKPMKSRFYWTIRAFLRCLYLNSVNLKTDDSICFTSFVEENFELTAKYRSYDALKKHCPKEDAYISGSDQLWNPELLDHRFDEAYFLKFAPANAIKIAYAVSMGRLPDNIRLEELQALCNDLSAISLREYDETVINAIGRDVHICIDPTLLLTASDYAEVESKSVESEPYIFVYGFETNQEIQSAVDLAVSVCGCKVINGSPHRIRLECNATKVDNYGPGQFLSYVKNAQCVVTNSFHGTAFSIVYNKRFITVPHSTRGSRMTELLEKLGLNTCLWGHSSFSFNDVPNYAEVERKLILLKDDSLKYLISALSSNSSEVGSVKENSLNTHTHARERGSMKRVILKRFWVIISKKKNC